MGQYDQLNRVDDLEKLIKETAFKSPAIFESGLFPDGSATGEEHAKKKLIEVSLQVLRDPNNVAAAEEAKEYLLTVGKSHQVIAFVIRSLGFRAHTKFGADFDLAVACEASILHLTSFLTDARACLKEGNVANIKQASHDAWKDIFRERMSDFADTALVMDILKLEDLMDGAAALANLQSKTSKQADDASKTRTIIQTGRAASTAQMEETKKLGHIKRKLSELTSEGDSIASSLLQKLDETPALEDADAAGAEGGRKSARKRGIHRQRKKRARRGKLGATRYRRQQGDELRLIKKREIVLQYDMQQLFVFCVQSVS